ncbi:ATP-binding protein [Sulfurimonas sp. HSL1-6]|uniref:hybrid sensor histidine kinase/response regulator n=1 Tax=Thiomicrolovo immobilis TaxID=3131935 RepID=UPI0031F8825B
MPSVPQLRRVIDRFKEAKATILQRWVSYETAESVLKRHGIETDFFIRQYASGVYDYFEMVIRGEMQIGDCPVMAELLEYLKDNEVTSDELFMLCSHFRRAMVDISYELGVNSQEVYDEISYVFDLNFSGVLKRYTETIYQKEREIERNVKLLEEYRRAIDESAIVAKTDAQGTITYANAKLTRICGYSQEELVGSPHTMLYHPDMPGNFFNRLAAAIGEEGVFKGTIKGRAKDESTFYIDTTVVPITDTHNAVTEYMAISYEVTDLVVAKEEAIAAGEAKEYFLSNMSHEIRTPLNAILGFVALLKDEAQTVKDRRYLDIIYSSGENLLSIINDILDFSKLRSGEFTVEPAPFNLHSTISHTLELFVPSVNQQHLTLTSFIDPRIPYELIADPLRIQQVISNLLSNAIKFTPPGGEITVEAFYTEGRISISVIDTGIGIAAKDQHYIFDPFSQARNEDLPGVGGTGLGLSISAQLVRHMGGEITLHSHPGIGSTFTFTLPVIVGDETRPLLTDLECIRKHRLALYCPEQKFDTMAASLMRYLQSFGVKIKSVEALDGSYDLLFFSEHCVGEAQRKALLAEGSPKVALMDAPYDTYENISGVTPLVMPLYCSKLQEVIETALMGDTEPEPRADTAGVRFNAHLLVAEDNEANQELIGTLLGNLGVSYEIVGNGAEALKRMRTEHYDLVLMDEQMPVMNGRDAVQAMRHIENREGRQHLPIIALTANVLGGIEQRRIYDDFLGKPIRMATLISSLERFIPRAEDAAAEETAPETVLPEHKELREILQVTEAQLQMLLGVYREKMQSSFEELEAAIDAEDLKQVTLLAHSIKGSSSNFRFDSMTKLAEKMEWEARAGNAALDYTGMLGSMRGCFNAFIGEGS